MSTFRGADHLSSNDARIRVCFVIPSLGDGGAQRQCIALINTLQYSPRVELHLILLNRGEHDDSLDSSHVRLHRIEVGNFASPVAFSFIVRTLIRVRPDILLSWLHPADILAYAATRIVRRVKWVMTERDSAYPDQLIFNLRKRLGRSASAIVANSEQGERMWRSLAPSTTVLHIPNILLSSPPLNGSRQNSENSNICLSVGRLEPQKNVLMMANAFADFAVGQPNARLVVVGAGSEAEKLRQIIDINHLTPRADFLGFRRDVPELMSAARVLLSLSRHEGMPNVLMEAVVARLPAVVSDIPQHRALLGPDYPYYVKLDAPTREAAAVIAQAWTDATAREKSDPYGYARDVIRIMTPELVAEAYLGMFVTAMRK